MCVDPRILTALASAAPNVDRTAWHGAATPVGSLRGVEARMAVWRPYPEANCIREIALHVAFYENSVANRLSGDSARLEIPLRKSGWPTRLEKVSAERWKADVALVKRSRTRLETAVAGLDPQRLDEKGGPETDRPLVQFIHGVAEHSLYHVGQIVVLKELAKRAIDAERT